MKPDKWWNNFDKKELNQVVLYEMYRQGRFEVAKTFALEMGMEEPLQDVQKFKQMWKMLDSLDRFNILPALQFFIYLLFFLNKKKKKKYTHI
ncbi:hypothetical protein RFI_21533 [Reticulomyxa filosa]|uniref:Uncharacterized protein n=1 Tax=Reticulomyxa filosa TaxID=46433 RepID=X6MQB0_RETFI|nr:hypothetical protein RFI_21533 [Reticulomyxa filosa]|eukprot:ETO15831.1 hypothetical protein RFI_21533 [Reticulomyxa filosa]